MPHVFGSFGKYTGLSNERQANLESCFSSTMTNIIHGPSGLSSLRVSISPKTTTSSLLITLVLHSHCCFLQYIGIPDYLNIELNYTSRDGTAKTWPMCWGSVIMPFSLLYPSQHLSLVQGTWNENVYLAQPSMMASRRLCAGISSAVSLIITGCRICGY